LEDSSKPLSPSIAEQTEQAGVTAAESNASAEAPPPVICWREIVAVTLLVVLCDLTIYRGAGFAGYGLLFIAAPVLLLAGALRPRFAWSAVIVGFMTLAAAAKLLWCGSLLLVAAGFALLVAFAMTVSGQIPYVLELLVFASQTIRGGYEGFFHYGRFCGRLRIGSTTVGASSLAIGLPVMAALVFGMIFILANPDLFSYFSESIEIALTRLRDWIVQFSLTEVMFWFVVSWIGIGLLRPLTIGPFGSETSQSKAAATADTPDSPAQSMLYPAFRNTLLTVIALFAIYLAFEFKTLWFREFPKGFYYAGYAHEGAAWLTLALALATVVLSLVFRGQIIQDTRLPRLRWLAWIWSIENFVLAAAVYHRLFIYIDFNGLTRMRIVGIFGMSAVAVGFMLVVWKIANNRNFIWLLRRHLWTLALTVYLFALTPIDTLVVWYNVRQVLAGDPKASVQIVVQPIDSEGILLLQPLLEAEDEIIREGVRAMLAQRLEDAEQLAEVRLEQGWTAFQMSDARVLERLRAARGNWSDYRSGEQRREAIDRFRDYALQWY
jgi:hypothetical protein